MLVVKASAAEVRMFGEGRGRRGGAPMGFGGGFGPPPFARMLHLFGGSGSFLRGLNLNDEQLERIAELKLATMRQHMQMRLSMSALMKDMVKELSNDPIDKAKVKEIGKQIQTQKMQAGDEFFDRIISFAEVLTPEQRKAMRMKAIKSFLGMESSHGEPCD
jgi:Spy/CpxP family protein refolding chaperone